MAGLAPDVYNWRAKGPKYLANSGSLQLEGSNVTSWKVINLRTFQPSNVQTLEIGLMRVGDANNDNVVNINDFNIFRNTFGKACGDLGYDDRAEFNGDCAVNITDFSLLRPNFGQGGAPPIHVGP